MTKIHALPTYAAEVDENVREKFEQVRAYVESGEVSGMAIGLTFRDGRSFTTATKAEDRRVMLALLLDSLLEYQKNSS